MPVQACFGRVRACFGRVRACFWACFGRVLGVFWACFGRVLGVQVFRVVDIFEGQKGDQGGGPKMAKIQHGVKHGHL